ncbi:MAG: protease inhibitor I42 family protein [Chloroflexia bacterium]|nr:protease inhibitor I42 family protein [Chloroflexia bacterium]
MLKGLQYLGKVVVLLAVSLLAAGCGSAQEVRVGAGDNGELVELEVGQTLVVTLASNPSTGYSWQVVKAGASVLEQQGEAEYESSDTRDPPPPGSGGTETFRFEAKSAGQAELELVYHRPWEEDVEPLETFTLQVKVR